MSEGPSPSNAERSLALLTRLVELGEKSLAAQLEGLRLIRKLLPPEPPRVATDEELDDTRGDPFVKVQLRQWKGQNFKGRRFSECSPEFLGVLADFFMWAAAKKREEGDAKLASYNELDAARARGWARRIRAKQEEQRIKDALASDDYQHDAAEPPEPEPPKDDEEWA
jgi:hypothetical protein